MAKQQADLAQQQWDRYLSVFSPLENQMITEAQTPARESPGFLAEMGGINQRYGDASGNLRRMMGGTYSSGAGVAAAGQRSLDLNRGKSLASAESNYNNQRWDRMLGMANLGRGLPATSTAGLASAGNLYGSLANMYGNLSGQAFGGVGQGVGNLYQMYALYNRNKNSTSPSAWTGMSSGLEDMGYYPTSY